MAPRTNLAPALIAAAFAIGSGPPVLAQTAVEAQTWDDAISKLECKDINKNADGSYSVTAVVKIKSKEQHNPIINVPQYKIRDRGKEMLRPGSLRSRLWKAGIRLWKKHNALLVRRSPWQPVEKVPHQSWRRGSHELDRSPPHHVPLARARVQSGSVGVFCLVAVKIARVKTSRSRLGSHSSA